MLDGGGGHATNVQLANFAALTCFGAAASPTQREVALALIQASPTMRDAWQERHEAFQDELRKLGKPS